MSACGVGAYVWDGCTAGVDTWQGWTRGRGGHVEASPTRAAALYPLPPSACPWPQHTHIHTNTHTHRAAVRLPPAPRPPPCRGRRALKPHLCPPSSADLAPHTLVPAPRTTALSSSTTITTTKLPTPARLPAALLPSVAPPPPAPPPPSSPHPQTNIQLPRHRAHRAAWPNYNGTLLTCMPHRQGPHPPQVRRPTDKTHTYRSCSPAGSRSGLKA